MRRKWVKRVIAILLTPILLFAVLMLLLYIPPVQNFLRKEALGYASEATGMQISARRIDLRFPLNLLVSDLGVVHSSDTLLSVESLNVRVQLLPLFSGRIEIDDFTLKRVGFNSADLIHGMELRGVLGYFAFRSRGVNLSNQTAIIDAAELNNTHLRLILKNDTVKTPEDSTASPRWKIDLHNLKLKNVSFNMLLPEDSVRMGTHVAEATINGAQVDLGRELYGLKHMHASGTSLNYDIGSAKPAKGFDLSHIAIRELNMGIDSVLYRGRNINAAIREFSLNERSGLSITSMTGRLSANDTAIKVSSLKLKTAHSEIDFTGRTTWKLIDLPGQQGHLSMKLDALIGKQDLLLFAGKLPDAFKKEYPFRPLTIHAGAEGNLTNLKLSRFKIDLPGAFSATGGGELLNFTDSLKRFASVDLQAITHNLNFLATFFATPADGSIVFPQGMTFIAKAEMRGLRFRTLLRAKDGEGALSLTADYDHRTEVYNADFTIDALQMKHFLPKDSIYSLSASGSIKGRGVDVASSRSSAQFEALLNDLHYGRFHVSDVTLTGQMKNALIKAHLASNNQLLKLVADGEYQLNRKYTEGKLDLNVEQIDWYKLGYYPTPMKRAFAFTLAAQTRRDSVNLSLQAGDLNCRFRGRSTLEQLIKQSTDFSTILIKQIKGKLLDHAALRRALPSAGLIFTAGKDNPLSRFLATKEIAYDKVSFRFGTTPTRGINGRAFIHGLRVDSTLLDTLFLTIRQDTARMNIRGGVINAPNNPRFVFKSYITGEIRTEDAELTLEYQNAKGETGVLLGVNARPRNNGLLFKFIPEEPIVAFRKFRFNDDNRVYLRKDRHIFANVEMLDKDGMGVRVHSLRDTTFLQNMDIELRRIRLAEISEAFPYLPQFSGLFSAEAHYVQTATSLQVSTEATINELVYEHQSVGNIGLGATWLPGERGKHYVNSYLTHEGTEVMTVNGEYRSGVKDSMDINSTLEHFPLRIANMFVPDQVVAFSGDLDGNLHLSGQSAKPLMNGELMLDSVSVFARQASARYWLDNRPVKIVNSRMEFDKFAISTTSKNPFTIDGYVDFKELSIPTANLSMKANNYTLLDAPRTNESLIYGKLFVDLNATVRGPLDALVMRGNMNVRGNTNVTYVLRDSPLTVQDRLGDLVTFTSFNDTLSQKKEEEPTISLGGLDMLVTLHIDPAVRLKADLSPDRSSRVELEGGGDLSLQYSPRGDLRLSGRYTLSGGILKYALPVIPLKEFAVNDGSYVEWTGNPMDPNLSLKATERVRASVSGSDGSSRMVNFDISIAVKNQMENLALVFDLEAPEDADVQTEISAMSVEERSKQAIAMLATGIYLANSGTDKNGGLNMGAALNNVLQNQIANVAGAALKTVNISFAMENYDNTNVGGKRTDYNFRYAQRFFNDRFQVVLGGTISTGENADETQSFIDNVSLEYRLDASGTRYVRIFHDKNYESVFEGEITETGVGIVLRKKMNRLGELFIFRRKK